jgi:protein-tyrosine phosphatase
LIDLHCHLLPGIDDGATDLETALAMAKIAVADGVEIIACTPHITPGVYDNQGPDIALAIISLQAALDAAGIPLQLTCGADAHLAPELGQGLRSGRVPSLGGSRYFLLEPPHHVAPPRLDLAVQDLLDQGYVPVITHPERLTWIEDHYNQMKALVGAGAWLQITAGSLTGRFGPRPRYWAERMVDEGLTHILATDAHNLRNRAPHLAEGREAVAARLGAEEARRMVLDRPRGMLANADPETLSPPNPPRPGLSLSGLSISGLSLSGARARGWMSKLFHVS